MPVPAASALFFFLNDPATPEIYTLPLHAALPICAEFRRLFPPPPLRFRSGLFDFFGHFAHPEVLGRRRGEGKRPGVNAVSIETRPSPAIRSEEHTSELQSQSNLVCRLLLEKKKHH